jgi:hypothetical protein
MMAVADSSSFIYFTEGPDKEISRRIFVSKNV